MTPEEYLAFVGQAKGLRGEALYTDIDRVIEKTGLTQYRSRLIKNLSKGYRQRVGIAQAILGDPQIIILDEPTVGLDPRQIIEIRELIKELGRGHTVILSSHILTEISAVCDYVIIIAKGQIVASDTLESLTKKYEGKNYVDLLVKGEEGRIRKLLSSIRGILDTEMEPRLPGQIHVRLAVDAGYDVREDLFYRFADAKMPLLSMEYEEVTLEKVFLELTGEGGHTSAAAKADMLSRVDERTDESPASAEESTDAPAAEAPAEEKAAAGDDDYTPLFGDN
jgi:ABC-2 type transport system ATP-binding protein